MKTKSTSVPYVPTKRTNLTVKNGLGEELADIALATSSTGTSTDDPILYWNRVALEANRVSHTNGKGEQTGPTLSARALAIVHLAMHDAYGAITHDPVVPTYYADPPTVTGTPSATVAVAAAAYRTLCSLFPSQKAYFTEEWNKANLAGPGYNEGRNYGMAVADKILKERKDDPDASDVGYAPSTARGAHRPDPSNPGQGFYAPFYGARTPLFATAERFQLDSPPALDSLEYQAALVEVYGKGITPTQMGTVPDGIVKRTAEEAVIGNYWAYDGAVQLGTPPRLYNQIIREVAIKQGNSVAENARLFALVNVAMADAGILAWDQKYIHDLWRPVHGVRENDTSTGPQGVAAAAVTAIADPAWLPIGAPKSNEVKKNFTPPFPAYPSGHATFGAAAFHMTRLFYGQGNKDAAGNYSTDTLFDDLSFVSDEHNGITTDNQGVVRTRSVRSFPDGLWQMIEENGRSRVYLGVHWVFDAFAVDANGQMDLTKNIGGVPLGLKIAESIFSGTRASGLKKP